MPADLNDFTQLLAALQLTPAPPLLPQPLPIQPLPWMRDIPLVRSGCLRKQYEESMRSRVATVKFNLQLLRSKPELFKRQLQAQQRRVTSRQPPTHPTIPEQLSRREVVIYRMHGRSEKLSFCGEDLAKLQPGADLNDTIVEGYLKLLVAAFLPSEIATNCHCFSSFLLEKLLGDLIRDEQVLEQNMNHSQSLVRLVRDRVGENYTQVRRWTKMTDIFTKKVLVFPVNAFRHWYCLLVVNPAALLSGHGGCFLYTCDSMFERREFIAEGVRKYLQLELEDKKRERFPPLTAVSLPHLQLLLPRQTNTHDCGLYMLTYIEELLRRPLPPALNQLRLFPHALILSLRARLSHLLLQLYTCGQGSVSSVLESFSRERERIMCNAEQDDYDSIDERELKKYMKMGMALLEDRPKDEQEHACLIRYYLDPEINHYEKDKFE